MGFGIYEGGNINFDGALFKVGRIVFVYFFFVVVVVFFNCFYLPK